MVNLASADILGTYLHRILRPFVRFALRHGLRLPDILETLRKTFVEVAREEIERLNQKPSVSRLAVTTGMNRRDVQRASTGEAFRDITLSVPTRVIGLWHTHPEFQSKQGKPRTLSVGSPESEFTALVQRVTHDIHPASVLFELERVGAVLHTARGVQVVTQGYRSSDPQQGIRMLSEDLEQLIFAVDENLFTNREQANLHVRTVSSFISMEDAPTISDWLLREGGSFHRRVRDFLSDFDLQLNPASKKKANAQIVVTSFGRISSTKISDGK